MEPQNEQEDVLTRSWEEVEGTLDALSYCREQARLAAEQGDLDTARLWLTRMAASQPTSSLVQLAAGGGYWLIGDLTAAAMHYGIALALDPENYVVARHLASLLAKRGAPPEQIEAILEQGWKQCQRSNKRRLFFRQFCSYPPMSRTQYFTLMDGLTWR